MKNKAMERKLNPTSKIQCLDVRVIGKETDDPLIFELEDFIEDVDYCDKETERWIWSIGRRNADGKIFASIDTRFYQNPEYECLWLR
jgi:hypothetical protein